MAQNEPYEDNPFGIANEAFERIMEGEVRSVNAEAGKAVAEAVRTSIGPKGMDKMLVDTLGEVTITNDGRLILAEMDIKHPAAKMIVEASDSLENEVGDGTTTATVLTGELLSRAMELIDEGMHPTSVIAGFERALDAALDAINEMTIDVDLDDDRMLRNLAETAMTGKLAERRSEELSEMIIRAVRAVEDDGRVDVDRIQVERIQGGRTADSELVNGTIFEQVRAHENMPTRVRDANIALIKTELGAGPELDFGVSLEATADIDGFVERQSERYRQVVETLTDAGVDVVFTSEELNAEVAEYLSKVDILTAESTNDESFKRLKHSTGANIVSHLAEFSEADVGYAGTVEVVKQDWKTLFYVEECEGDHMVLLMRGGTETSQQELERAIGNGISVVSLTFEGERVVPGAGAPEAVAAQRVRDEAVSVPSRQQLAMQGFADALEFIPRTLAQSAGMDEIEAVMELRNLHANGESTVGINVLDRSVEPMDESGVFDIHTVKTHALEVGTQTVSMLLRIDDLLIAEELSEETLSDPTDMGEDLPRSS